MPLKSQTKSDWKGNTNLKILKKEYYTRQNHRLETEEGVQN